MRRLLSRAVAAAAALGAAAALAAVGPPPVARPEYQRARGIALQVLADTRALLEREIAAKGAAGALHACSAVALEEARKHEEPGWRVRRVTLKVRNPADTPDRYERRVLREFARLQDAGRLSAETEHVTVGVERGHPVLRYLKPITIPGPLCLNCHGPRGDLDAEVRAALRARYPNDRATGYRVGDLRGAISIRVPLESAQLGQQD